MLLLDKLSEQQQQEMLPLCLTGFYLRKPVKILDPKQLSNEALYQGLSTLSYKITTGENLLMQMPNWNIFLCMGGAIENLEWVKHNGGKAR